MSASSCSSPQITSQSDADDIKDCALVTGDINIVPGATGNISLDGIRNITGSLTSSCSSTSSQNCSGLVRLSSSTLEGIGGSLVLDGLDGLTELSLPTLDSAETIKLHNLALLKSIDVSLLKNLTYFQLENAPQLSSFYVGELPDGSASGDYTNSTNYFSVHANVSRCSIGEVPSLTQLNIATASFGELNINGNGNLSVLYTMPSSEGLYDYPMHINLLNASGLASFDQRLLYPMLTVDTFVAWNNSFSSWFIPVGRVRALELRQNSNLVDLNYHMVSWGWESIKIIDNPLLFMNGSNEWGFPDDWRWQRSGIVSEVILHGNFTENFFDTLTLQKKYYDPDIVITDRFEVSSTFPGFDCRQLDKARKAGRIIGDYTCQGRTIAKGQSAAAAVQPEFMSLILLFLISISCCIRGTRWV